MRAVIILFLLIISICQRFGQTLQQTNFENKPLLTANKRLNSVGQQEFYIPYTSDSTQQRPQEFQNNFGNAYQFLQYKYMNRLPLTKQWTSNPTLFGKYRNFPQKSQNYDNSDDNDNAMTGSVNLNDRPVAQEINVKNSISKTKSRDIENKVKDFSEEQVKLNKAGIASSEYSDENSGGLEDSVMGPVMRRKSSLYKSGYQSASLQSNDPKSIPIPSARQQEFSPQNGSLDDVYFVAIVACVSAVAIFGVIGAGYCFYKVQQSNKAAADVDYPAYGVVGPASKETNTTGNISPSGDRKLAQSAQMYHYHHQKQQMIASEKAVTPRHTSASDNESDEENEEGEYTVYECPGLAPTGEMEVKNPLFHDDITPVSSPPVTGNNKEK